MKSHSLRFQSITSSGPQSEIQPEHTVVRERFSSRIEPMLTYIAYIVGPANLMYFPFYAFKHGARNKVIFFSLMCCCCFFFFFLKELHPQAGDGLAWSQR
jgi:hypothetical protein